VEKTNLVALIHSYVDVTIPSAPDSVTVTMRQIRNVVTFQAPHCLTENISDREGLFEAEAQLSQFLAGQLAESGLKVGKGIKERKVHCVSRKVEVGNKAFWILVSYERLEWTVTIMPNWVLSFILGPTNSVQMERLRQLIDQALNQDEGISDVEWRTG
jgi:hypothetical protein